MNVRYYFVLLIVSSALGLEQGEELAANDARVKRSDDLSASQVELANLAHQVTHQQAEITALKNQLTKVQSDLGKSRTSVGFYAYRSASHFTMTGHGTMILDHTYTNTGHAFDTHSGTFTAPVSGTYAFFLTIRNYDNNTLVVSIAVEGTSKSVAYVHNSNEQATAHAYLHLTKGNRVWAKNGSSSNRNVYGGTSTHFSGFLVQADP